ncbi:Endonuclease 1 [Rhizoctonia solani]|uniref:Endonuclease 1 n=1 Tax=Rhizoctonia solani TaxID=456999 RepID=A0A0K6G6A9_9AGAM|nr:Endonuclease 1 [Rhizoctonia solani]
MSIPEPVTRALSADQQPAILNPQQAGHILRPSQRLIMRFLFLAASALGMAIPAWGWGKEGHRMTATIAQIHLLPSAHRAVCSILDKDFNCSLASVATWPDDVRRTKEWGWSRTLHFVNGIDDKPPKECSFGTKGWVLPSDFHILSAVVDMTRRVHTLNSDGRNYSLSFLTHFLGDIHQPLHLTGHYAGGNGVPVLFGERSISLHKVWDDDLVWQRIESAKSNGYSHALQTSPGSDPALGRNRQIEAALNGLNYDPLIRWIVSEGIDRRWASQVREWITCPPLAITGRVDQQTMGSDAPPFNDPTDLPVCPYPWAKASHQMLCDFIWRPDLEGVEDMKIVVDRIQLNTPEYAGQVGERKIIEEQIAKGGLRLAVALNTILGSEEEKQAFGLLFGVDF